MTLRFEVSTPCRGAACRVFARFTTAMVLGLVACAPSAQAQADEPLATDRPDFTETTLAIPPGRVQIEAGCTREGFGVGRADHAPELLIRTGFLTNCELRLGYDRAWVSGPDDPDELSAGMKVAFGSGTEPWTFAMIGAGTWTNVRAGDLESDSDLALELLGVWSREISSRWAIGGIAGGVWDQVDDRGTDAAIGTVSLGLGLNDRAGTFFEWAGELPRGGEAAHIAHHGYTWRFDRNFQIDIHGAAGLTSAAPDWFVGFGLGWQTGTPGMSPRR